MKRWIGLASLIFVGAAGWRIGGTLSPDALSMAIGLLFGILAGVPTALLVMAGSRRRHHEERTEENRSRQQFSPMHGQPNAWGMSYAQQPPIIVVAGPQGMGNIPQLPQPNAGWHPHETSARQFTVVGDREELSDDW